MVGAQRQAAAKPAGLRTHLLVATASAAFTAMGAHLGDTRIPSYVVVGIGFLGAGAIVREGSSARGLTTAASIWMAAAIGLLMGYSNSFGLYTAMTATAITLMALVLSDEAMMRLLRIPRKAMVRVLCECPRAVGETIEAAFRSDGVKFENSDVLTISKESEIETGELSFLVTVPWHKGVDDVMHRLGAIPGVRRVSANIPFYMG